MYPGLITQPGLQQGTMQSAGHTRSRCCKDQETKANGTRPRVTPKTRLGCLAGGHSLSRNLIESHYKKKTPSACSASIMERTILQATNSACTGPARTLFLCKTWLLCITRFVCKTALRVKDSFDAKTLFLFKPRLNLNQNMCVNQGLGKGHI